MLLFYSPGYIPSPFFFSLIDNEVGRPRHVCDVILAGEN